MQHKITMLRYFISYSYINDFSINDMLFVNVLNEGNNVITKWRIQLSKGRM